jgi:hypothetical protein
MRRRAGVVLGSAGWAAFREFVLAVRAVKVFGATGVDSPFFRVTAYRVS